MAAYYVVSSWVFMIYVFLGCYAYKAEPGQKLNKLFLFFSLSLAMASLCNLFMTASQGSWTYWIWYKADVFFWCAFTGCSLNASLALTKRKHLLQKKTTYMIIYTPIFFITFVEVFLLRSKTIYSSLPELIFLGFEGIYLFIFPLAGAVNIWVWGRKSKRLREKKQANIIIAAAVVNTVLSLANTVIIYLLNITSIPDITHIISMIVGLSICYATLKYRLINLKSLVSVEDIIDKVTDIIFLLDTSERITSINRRCEELTGYTARELAGRHINSMIRHWNGTLLKGETPESTDIFSSDLYCISKDGKYIPISIQASPVTDKMGEVVGTVIVCKDMTLVKELRKEIEERKERENELNYLSLHDSLTGLYNRRYFEQKLQKLELEECSTIGIVISDVDGLKLINDTLGHNAGDKLLAESADIISKAFKSQGTIFRIGGDEFAVLVPKANIQLLQEAEANIYHSVKNRNERTRSFHISMSVGYSTRISSKQSIIDVFKEADSNMYRKKLGHAKSTRSSMTQGLIKMLEDRDYISEGHGERMKGLAVELGRIINLPEGKLADLRLLAQFHDIGKVGISDRILFKKGLLSEFEWTEMKRHSEIGYRIAKSISELNTVAELILKHHEQWNGSGYPLGLKGHDIPVECRILSIVDAYDAMVNDRPYRQALSPEAAMEELIKNAGSQFDPELIEEFLQMMNGTAVKDVI